MYTICKMMAHAELLLELATPLVGLGAGNVGVEYYERPFTHPLSKKMFAEKYSVRHFPPSRGAARSGTSKNVYWLPRQEGSADGIAQQGCDMVPLLLLMK